MILENLNIIEEKILNTIKLYERNNEILDEITINKNYGLLPTCTCGGNNETEWIQQCFSNWTAMSCIYSKFERKQMY